MSWSIRFIGLPSAVATALDQAAEKMSGTSLEEYLVAKSAIQQLVLINSSEAVLDVDANGSAWGEVSNCNVNIRKLGPLVC